MGGGGGQASYCRAGWGVRWGGWVGGLGGGAGKSLQSRPGCKVVGGGQASLCRAGQGVCRGRGVGFLAAEPSKNVVCKLTKTCSFEFCCPGLVSCWKPRVSQG